MKLFYKKDFIRVSGDLEKLQEEHDKLTRKFNDEEFQYLDEYTKYRSKYEKQKDKYNDLLTMKRLIEKENEELKTKIKSINGQKGNLTKRNNELTKRVEELEKQLEDSMSNKYLVRKLPSGKTPKGQVMKVKGSAKESAAIKLVKEKC